MSSSCLPTLPASFDRQTRLIRRVQSYWLIPASPLPVFPELPLPHLPLSLVQWLLQAHRLFWRSHHKCLAFTLLVDPHSRQWQAVPPTQRSTARRSIWTYRQDDYEDRGTAVVAGSFQTARFTGVFNAIDLVPLFDGVHVIASATKSSRQTLFFLRSVGNAMLASPADLLVDDVKDVFVRYSERFEFPLAR